MTKRSSFNTPHRKQKRNTNHTKNGNENSSKGWIKSVCPTRHINNVTRREMHWVTNIKKNIKKEKMIVTWF